VLIARLIADNIDWETRLKEMRLALKGPAGVSFPFSRRDLEPNVMKLPDSDSSVVELHFPQNDLGLAQNVIAKFFPDCNALFAQDEITIPRLFISDMDSTMIGQECIDELADFAGLKAQISDITERAMQGELDFESALLERVALLKGLEVSAIQHCLNERITPTPGARILTQTLKAHGARTVLVTGGFHHFADAVADQLGFDHVVGNRLGVEGGALTGALDGPITDASTKEAVLREEEANLGGTVLATGDGANDIPMLKAASYGFAYRAKPKARAAANGTVDHGDLTAILSLLGISRDQWVID